MVIFRYNFKLSIVLIIVFILMTVIGTLTHELGHYTVAKLLGYDAKINYQSTSYNNNEVLDFLDEYSNKYRYELKNNLDFPEKEKYFNLTNNYRWHHFLFILGGPVQTILTGTIGLLLLIVYKKKYITTEKVSIIGWVLIFLALFWLRQSANLISALAYYFLFNSSSISGDEMRLAYYLEINMWSIQIITGLIGFVVLFYVIKILPNNIKLTFMVSGLIGGILGYYLWLIQFGKVIMP